MSNKKNQYKVFKVVEGEVIEHSSHNNFEYAVIQRDQLRKKDTSDQILVFNFRRRTKFAFFRQNS